MSEIIEFEGKVKDNLKERLNEIESIAKNLSEEGFKRSRLIIEVSMWYKGEAIGEFTGGKIANWRELERQTSRNHESLKKWYELYLKYPTLEAYMPIAEQRALDWTNKVFLPKSQKEKIEALPLPEGKFEVIIIDPPWSYGTNYDAEGRRIASPYPEMSLEEIIDEPIPEKASDNCIIWFWTTHKFMHDAFHILEYWNFEPKVILTWVKNRMGMGVWLRSITEFCIMATKGNPKVNLTNQTTVIHADVREHSRKPNEFYDMIKELCNGRIIDWFGREKREGFEIYGNEPNKFN